MNKDITDDALMQRYCRGDSSAFDILYARHKDSIYRYVLRHCRSTSLAEEIFQDTWLKLINAREQYQSQQSSSFTAYLYRIAHNRMVDVFRRAELERNAFVDGGDQVEQYADNHQSMTNQLHQQQQVQALLVEVGKLPHEQREAFLLHEEVGFTLNEIADIMQVSRETVKSRLRYALSKLRNSLVTEDGNRIGESA